MPAFRITRPYLDSETIKTGSGRRIRIGDFRVVALVAAQSSHMKSAARRVTTSKRCRSDDPGRLLQALQLNRSLAIAYYLTDDLNELWEQSDK